MESQRLTALLCLLAGLWTPIRAQNKPEAALTLSRCVEIALERHPLLLSSRESYESALARARQARELAPPSFELDSDLQSAPFSLGSSGETYVGLSQTLEFPGRRILRGRIADHEAEQASADIESLQLDLRFRVAEAFYGLILAGEKIQYAQQDADLAADFLAKAEAKLAAGDTAEVEVLRARVEASKATAGLLTARNEKRLAEARLNYLLARGPRQPLAVREDPLPTLAQLEPDRLQELADAERPEMRKLRAAEAAGALKLRQARRSLWPDFSLGLSRHRLAGEATTWDLTLSFALPVFFWQPKRGAMAEAEADARSLRRDAEDLQNRIGREVEEAAAHAEAARAQIGLYADKIVRPAEEAYAAFLYRYERGEIGGIELIEARRSLLDARRSYAEARMSYRLTLAALERAVGRPLQGDSDEK